MELRAAIAAYTNRYFGPSELVSAESIVVGNGVSSLLGTLAFNVCDLNEALLIETPNYGMFEVDLTYQNGIQLVFVDTEPINDPFSAPCAGELIGAYKSSISDAEARGITVKAVVLCNPCNPSGRCYSRASIATIKRFCSWHDLHLIVDEIYAMSSGSSTAKLDSFTSVLAVTEEAAEEDMSRNVHILSGISKDFGLGGLRLGWLITRNELVWKAVRRLACVGKTSPGLLWHRWLRWPRVTEWVTGFSDKFATRLLSDLPFIADYSHLYKKRVEARRDHAMASLRSIGVPFAENNAGLFLWIDLSSWITSFRESETEASFNAAVQCNTSPTLAMSVYLMKRGIFLQPDDVSKSRQPPTSL
jgi:aspartate/methionine/tyrosine aminotransferase